MSKQYISMFTLVVDDYDKAINYYKDCLRFSLVEDTPLTEIKRWVRMKPPGDSNTCILIAKSKNETETKAIGFQTGGRVSFFLYTDSFWEDYRYMLEKEVKFINEPREEEYGTVVVFEDLYGNKWDFIQPIS